MLITIYTEGKVWTIYWTYFSILCLESRILFSCSFVVIGCAFLTGSSLLQHKMLYLQISIQKHFIRQSVWIIISVIKLYFICNHTWKSLKRQSCIGSHQNFTTKLVRIKNTLWGACLNITYSLPEPDRDDDRLLADPDSEPDLDRPLLLSSSSPELDEELLLSSSSEYTSLVNSFLGFSFFSFSFSFSSAETNSNWMAFTQHQWHKSPSSANVFKKKWFNWKFLYN